MLYGLRPEQNDYANSVPYVQYSGANRLLSPPECADIVAKMTAMELYPGAVGTTDKHRRLDPEYRSVFTQSLPVKGFEWLYERLLERISWVNKDRFRYELSGFGEHIQFLEYREAKDDTEVSGRYKWHLDYGPGVASTRKLSAVIQLSDPSEYEGCRLKLFDCTTPELEVPETGQGDMVVFCSRTPHCVTPLEKGTRRALALWVSGPTFR